MDNKASIGDLLYRAKWPVQHAGVYLGGNKVLHNSPDSGVDVVTLEEYSAGESVKVVSQKIDDLTLFKVRVEKVLNDKWGYHLITQNCEHLAHFLATGKKVSPQIQSSIAGGILGFCFGLLAKGKTKPGYVALGAGLGLALCNASRNYQST